MFLMRFHSLEEILINSAVSSDSNCFFRLKITIVVSCASSDLSWCKLRENVEETFPCLSISIKSKEESIWKYLNKEIKPSYPLHLFKIFYFP